MLIFELRPRDGGLYSKPHSRELFPEYLLNVYMDLALGELSYLEPGSQSLSIVPSPGTQGSGFFPHCVIPAF